MNQATYRHYPSFTCRYVRSVMKMLGLPKKPKVEAEIFGEMVHDEQVVHSINGEILMLEWHHGREGRVVVPEPSLSAWQQAVQLSKVERTWSPLRLPTWRAFRKVRSSWLRGVLSRGSCFFPVSKQRAWSRCAPLPGIAPACNSRAILRVIGPIMTRGPLARPL